MEKCICNQGPASPWFCKAHVLEDLTAQMRAVERTANETDPSPEELEHMKQEMKEIDRQIRALENQKGTGQ